MSQMLSFYNNGIFTINMPNAPYEEKTVIVLGAPRGGTSMVAGSLHLLGIQMGDRLTEATYEYPAMINAISNRKLDSVLKLINERNLKYQNWGWKQPVNIDYFFDEVLPHLRNPMLVTIYRDVLSIGNRNLISAGLDVLGNMLASLNLYRDMTEQIIKAGVPTLLVSYEKAIQQPKVFVTGLTAFLSINDTEMVTNAVAFIEPSPEKYLVKSYLLDNPSCGRLDNIRVTSATGWAFLKTKKKMVLVDLYVNNKLIMTTEANRFRKDLFAKGLHSDGNCGFLFRLDDKDQLKPGDSIRVRIKGEMRDIGNCPLIFKDNSN